MKCSELKTVLKRESVPAYAYNVLEKHRQVGAEEGFVIWKEDNKFVAAYIERGKHRILRTSSNEDEIVDVFLQEAVDYFPQLKKYIMEG